MKTELRPLMELCADSKVDVDADRDLAMRCCKLVMVLIKRMNDKTLEILKAPMKSISKSMVSIYYTYLHFMITPHILNFIYTLSYLLSYT